MTDRIRFLRRLFLSRAIAGAALAATFAAPVCLAQETVVELDPSQTKIEFTLGSTLHTVHGRFALKKGSLRFDPSSGRIEGSIIVDATSGESGNSDRDKRMHREILESGKYTEIILVPRQVKGAFVAPGPCKVEVSGEFRLHGQAHEVSFPVDVAAEGDQIRLEGRFTIPYVQWGLKDPSNFLLRASKQVQIEVHAAGRTESAEAPH